MMDHGQPQTRVLITGATGMIGAALADRLVADGHRVSVLIRPQSNRLRLQSLNGRLELITADLCDPEAVRKAVQEADPQAVFHLASTPFNPPTISPQRHVDVIIGGTLNLLEALRERPQVRVVATGSAAEYGSGTRLHEEQLPAPHTALGVAKATATLLLQMYARRHGLHTVILRLFTPFGPWERPGRLVPHAILSALDGQDVRLSDGRQRRDYLYIADVVEALILAATSPLAPGTVLNICAGESIAVRDIAQRITHLMGSPVKVMTGALPTRPDEIWELSGDNAAAREALGWVPRMNLEEGLRRTINWFTQHRELARQLT